jgi:predicted RNA binding protein YcfA (HicA-like mRNA interferase family)
MPKLPVLSAKEIISILKKEGFVITRQKGSHIALHKKTSEGIKLVVVPNKRNIPRGTLRDILHKAGISRERFFELK